MIVHSQPRSLSHRHARQSVRMLACTAECSRRRPPFAMVTAVDATSKRYRRHGRRAGLVGIMVRRARACLTVAAAWRRTPALTDRRSLSAPCETNRRRACQDVEDACISILPMWHAVVTLPLLATYVRRGTARTRLNSENESGGESGAPAPTRDGNAQLTARLAPRGAPSWTFFCPLAPGESMIHELSKEGDSRLAAWRL